MFRIIEFIKAIKKICSLFAIVIIQGFGIVSLIGKINQGTGNYYVNLVLLSITIACMLVSIVLTFVGAKRKSKKVVKKTIKTAKRVANRVNLVCAIGLTLYNVVLAIMVGNIFTALTEIFGAIGSFVLLAIKLSFDISRFMAEQHKKRFKKNVEKTAKNIFDSTKRIGSNAIATISGIFKKNDGDKKLKELNSAQKAALPEPKKKGLFARFGKQKVANEAIKEEKTTEVIKSEEKKPFLLFDKTRADDTVDKTEIESVETKVQEPANPDVERILAEAEMKKAEAEAMRGETEKIKTQAKANAEAEIALAKAEAEAIKAETERIKAETKAIAEAQKALAKAEAEAKRAAEEKARIEAQQKAEAEKALAKAKAEAKRAAEEKAKAEAAKTAAENGEKKKPFAFNVKLPDFGNIVKSAEGIIKSIGQKKADKPLDDMAENKSADTKEETVADAAESIVSDLDKNAPVESTREENNDTANV